MIFLFTNTEWIGFLEHSQIIKYDVKLNFLAGSMDPVARVKKSLSR